MCEFLTQHRPTILCLSETWMSPDSVDYINIQGYQLAAHFTRREREHGGCAIFSRCDIECKEICEIRDLGTELTMECCAALVHYDGYTFSIITVYRSPDGDIDEFMEKLADILLYIQNICNFVILCGDINVNGLVKCSASERLSDVFCSYGLINKNKSPTRVWTNKNGRTSKTEIDYIVCDIPEEDFDFNILHPGISDHLAQLLTVNIVSIKARDKASPNEKYTRNVSDGNIETLNNILRKNPWTPIDSRDVDEVFDDFMEHFLYYFDMICPRIKRRYQYVCKPVKWIDADVRESGTRLRAVHEMLTRSRCGEEDWEYYRKIRADHRRLIDLRKREYFSAKIGSSANPNKCIWTIVGSEVGRQRSIKPINLKTVDGEITDSLDVANAFGQYFSTAAETRIVQRYGSGTTGAYTSSRCQPHSMFMDPVSEDDIVEVIKGLKNKKSCGLDDIPVSVLKGVSDVIGAPLAHLINLSIESGVFPASLKVARVLPIHKKNSVSEMSNYRPVSVLPSFSKVYERVIHDQVVQYVNKYNIIKDNQHGFRQQRSTETALVDFANYIRKNMDQKKYVAALFFDFSAAFDSVDGEFVREKLWAIGIRGTVLDLIVSFLSCRRIVVDVGGTTSSPYNVNLGVAQGSILGPLIFVIFVNDMRDSVVGGHLINYADDTSMVLAGETVEELSAAVASVISDLKRWCSRNRLILNEDKTVRLNFYNRTDVIDYMDSSNADFTKFLGIFIDRDLNWSKEIDYVASRMGRGYYAMLRLKNCLDQKGLMQVYYSMVYSHMAYNIIVWGRAVGINRLFIMQKRIIRLIFNLKRDDSCKPIFGRHGIMTLPCVYIYKCAIYAYEHKSEFSITGQRHDYETRHGYNLLVPRHRTAAYEKSPHYACISVYNRLPSEVKNCATKYGFKRNLKKFLLEECFYDVKDYLAYGCTS